MSVPPGSAQLQRRTMRVLVAAQVFGGAGFFLGLAVAVLLARELTDSESLIGIPLAIMVASAALAAGPLGSWMQHSGRRPGLATGQLCGATGAAGVVLAARADSFAFFCVAMGLFGIGNASNLLARYAASDLPAAERSGAAGRSARCCWRRPPGRSWDRTWPKRRAAWATSSACPTRRRRSRSPRWRWR